MSPLTFKSVREMPMLSRSADTMAWNHTGSWRFLRPRYQDKDAPCSAACPTAEDIPLVELLASQGCFAEAWQRIREENPLPAVCGRVCFHPCEGGCNRGEYDDPVAINSLERHLADQARRQQLTAGAAPPPSGKRVAVVGAGPAGLSAAWFLGRLGHRVELYDAHEEPGGLLRYGIPSYRLPAEVLAWEAGLILEGDATFHPGRTLGKNLSWDELSSHDAVFLAVGAWRSNPLGIEGEDLAADGLAFLEAVRDERASAISGKVAVIGGGNTAVDLARTLLRLGAEPTIYYRRRLEDLPALPDEIKEATEEGIPIRPLLAPHRIEQGEDGLRLVLTPMQVAKDASLQARPTIAPTGAPDEEVTVTAVFTAIGFQNSPGLPAGSAQAVSPYLQRLLPAGAAEGPPVFVGGDLVNEERTVVTAIASGKAAAVAIAALFAGEEPAAKLEAGRVGTGGTVSFNRLSGGDRSAREPHVVGFDELNPIYFRYQGRTRRPGLTLKERRTTFDEVHMRISGALAMSEAERCFRCGMCDQCDNCYLFCPDMSVLRPADGESRRIDFDYCKGCGVCVVECPRNAMVLEEEPR